MSKSSTGFETLHSLDHTRPSSRLILYHYCNRDVLWSIIEKGAFWLSDIYTLNDRKELEWGREKFVRIVQQNSGLFDRDFEEITTNLVLGTDQYVRPFVGSFSANGDMLSQWRAYSEDGTGFSLGLRASCICKSWGVRLKKVEYRERRQETIILQSLVELQDVWRKIPKDLPSSMLAWVQVLMHFAIDLCSIKHPSFFEEREFRIVRAMQFIQGEYTDFGARRRGSLPVPVQSRMRGLEKIEYIALPIDANHEGNIVNKVVLGPKNTEELENFRTRIQRAGLHNFRVERSSTTYR